MACTCPWTAALIRAVSPERPGVPGPGRPAQRQAAKEDLLKPTSAAAGTPRWGPRPLARRNTARTRARSESLPDVVAPDDHMCCPWPRCSRRGRGAPGWPAPAHLMLPSSEQSGLSGRGPGARQARQAAQEDLPRPTGVAAGPPHRGPRPILRASAARTRARSESPRCPDPLMTKCVVSGLDVRALFEENLDGLLLPFVCCLHQRSVA